MSDPLEVGAGSHRYRALPNWGEWPEGKAPREVVGIAVDGEDRVYAFCRGEHPVVVFQPDGTLLRWWGAGRFRRPHGITLAPDGTLYCVDDVGHQIHRFTVEGDWLGANGTGEPSHTDVERGDYRTLKQPAGPFNLPTALAVGPDGDLYVSDGYGNCRVHRFSPDGRLQESWGVAGAGPGQFHVPHGIWVQADGTVLVSDRENSRVQRFTGAGEYCGEWPLRRPCLAITGGDGCVYVTELGYRAGMFPGNPAPSADPPGGGVAILSSEGELLARWGGGLDPSSPTDFYAAHGIALDSRGDLYVGEVRPGPASGCPPCPAGTPALRKYQRL